MSPSKTCVLSCKSLIYRTLQPHILDADDVTGRRRMVAQAKDFVEQAYFPNFSGKFISAKGRPLWLCYSESFHYGWNSMKLEFMSAGGQHGLCLFEARHLGPAEAARKTERQLR